MELSPCGMGGVELFLDNGGNQPFLDGWLYFMELLLNIGGGFGKS